MRNTMVKPESIKDMASIHHMFCAHVYFCDNGHIRMVGNIDIWGNGTIVNKKKKRRRHLSQKSIDCDVNGR